MKSLLIVLSLSAANSQEPASINLTEAIGAPSNWFYVQSDVSKKNITGTLRPVNQTSFTTTFFSFL
jgi:hypothetical protein